MSDNYTLTRRLDWAWRGLESKASCWHGSPHSQFSLLSSPGWGVRGRWRARPPAATATTSVPGSGWGGPGPGRPGSLATNQGNNQAVRLLMEDHGIIGIVIWVSELMDSIAQVFSVILLSYSAWGAAPWICQLPFPAHQCQVWRPDRDPLISPRPEQLSGPQILVSTALRDSRTGRDSCPGTKDSWEFREHHAILFNFREDRNDNSEEYKRVMARNGFGPNKSKVSRGLKIPEYV